MSSRIVGVGLMIMTVFLVVWSYANTHDRNGCPLVESDAWGMASCYFGRAIERAERTP